VFFCLTRGQRDGHLPCIVAILDERANTAHAGDCIGDAKAFLADCVLFKIRLRSEPSHYLIIQRANPYNQRSFPLKPSIKQFPLKPSIKQFPLKPSIKQIAIKGIRRAIIVFGKHQTIFIFWDMPYSF